MSWSGVYACSSSAPDSVCDGDGTQVFINSAELNSTSWVVDAPASNLAATEYDPVYAIPTGYMVKCSGGGGAPTCAGDVGGTGFVAPSALVFGLAAPYSPPFDISQLNTAMAGFAFSAGFLLVATGFFIGKPITILLGVIRS